MPAYRTSGCSSFEEGASVSSWIVLGQKASRPLKTMMPSRPKIAENYGKEPT
jgi:hypothetical protein